MSFPFSDDSLAAGVELLLLDAGNTVIFLDHARVAATLTRAGLPVTRERIVACEGEAKLALEDGGGTRVSWAHVDAPGARSWGNMIGTIATCAGFAEARVPELLDVFWREHLELNFWWLVPDGLGDALDAVRASGVPVVIVSNSEGLLDDLFAHLGIATHFDLVVDSGKLGIEKPDPRIWQVALAAYPTPADRVLHLGDTWATDTIGAERLGYRTALIDPHGFYDARHPSVARVTGVVEVARAIVRTRLGGPPRLDRARRGGIPRRMSLRAVVAVALFPALGVVACAQTVLPAAASTTLSSATLSEACKGPQFDADDADPHCISHATTQAAPPPKGALAITMHADSIVKSSHEAVVVVEMRNVTGAPLALEVDNSACAFVAVAKNDAATSFESDCNGLCARGPDAQVLHVTLDPDGVVVKRVHFYAIEKRVVLEHDRCADHSLGGLPAGRYELKVSLPWSDPAAEDASKSVERSVEMPLTVAP